MCTPRHMDKKIETPVSVLCGCVRSDVMDHIRTFTANE